MINMTAALANTRHYCVWTISLVISFRYSKLPGLEPTHFG